MPANQVYPDVIDIAKYFRDLWKNKVLIILGTGLFVLAGFVYSISLENLYQSNARLYPKQMDNGSAGSLSQLASAGLGSVASISGLGFGGGLSTLDYKTQIALETIKSIDFFEEYLYESMLIPLMATTGWERSTNRFVIDSNLYDIEKNKWVRDIAPPLTAKPSVQEAHREFLLAFSVDADIETGFITLSMEHYSPYFAKQTLDLMIKSISSKMRSSDVLEAEKAILFLNKQRKINQLVSIEQVFSKLVEEQTKTIMLANVSEDYVFKVVERPFVSELKSRPNRALICVLFTFVGLLALIVLVLIKEYLAANGNIKSA